MDLKQIAKQMMNMHKAIFDNIFKVMVFMQEQTENLASYFLEKSPWLSKDGKKVIDDWAKTCKKCQKDFKDTADESYKKIADLFDSTQK
ncbi:MAG: hypothetical protein JW976_09655 [Syntrophaceae bacterium]|nr:hypothetical protein [Syntrophaceae bacterium]